jgi:ABC-type transporter Mla MlaB component
MRVRYTTPRGGTQIADVSGLVRLPDARILAHEIEVRMKPDVVRVVVDLCRVEAVSDPALLAALRGVTNAMRRRAGHLTFVAKDKRLERLTQLARVDDVLEVFPSLGEAMAVDERVAHGAAAARG